MPLVLGEQHNFSMRKRSSNAEVNLVGRMNVICFSLNTKATTTPAFFFNLPQRADLLRQQICGGAEEDRPL